MTDHDSRQELCPACLTFPGEHDVRVISGSLAGPVIETWHKDDCPLASPPGDTGDKPTA